MNKNYLKITVTLSAICILGTGCGHSGNLSAGISDMTNTTEYTAAETPISQAAAETPDEASESNMTYSMSFYTDAPNKKSSVKIQYPVFSKGDSETLNQLIRQKVQGFAKIDTDDFPEDAALTVDYQSAVTLQNNKIVSMIFWGTSFIEGSAYGTSDLTALNIDLKTMKEVTLKELYQTDQDFQTVFFNKAFFPENPVTSYDKAGFPDMLKAQSPEYQTVNPFSTGDSVSCFLKPEGIVISMPSVHATGSDHFEAEVKYSDIRQFYLLQQNYWEQQAH